MDDMRYMKPTSKKRETEEHYDSMGKTHARRLCFCLDACRYMELHPEKISDPTDAIEEMRLRNNEMIAAWESLTEEPDLTLVGETEAGFVVRGNDRLRFAELAGEAAAMAPPKDQPPSR